MSIRSAVNISPGVLSKKQIEELVDSRAIFTTSGGNPAIDFAAIDLRLGNKAWKVRVGQRLTTRELDKIRDQSEAIKPTKKDKHGPYFEFERKNIYLIELDDELALPSNISGRATGKSSVGRLDVITRLITSDGHEYDVVPAGYSGRLYLLLVPQTFNICAAPGDSLNQLRLFSGPQSAAIIPRQLIPHYGLPFWYVRSDESDTECGTDVHGNFASHLMTGDPLLCDLTVDLADEEFQYIYKAKSNVSRYLDLRQKFYAGGGRYDPKKYFEKVPFTTDGAGPSVVLQKDSFYIMKSFERLAIPNDVAVEVIAISERIGDIRIHYAGFAHPGFGDKRRRGKKRGTPLIFEVRATDMETKLYHGSLLARIQLFRMSTVAKPDPSPYDKQELKLSKVFKAWSS